MDSFPSYTLKRKHSSTDLFPDETFSNFHIEVVKGFVPSLPVVDGLDKGPDLTSAHDSWRSRSYKKKTFFLQSRSIDDHSSSCGPALLSGVDTEVPNTNFSVNSSTRQSSRAASILVDDNITEDEVLCLSVTRPHASLARSLNLGRKKLSLNDFLSSGGILPIDYSDAASRVQSSVRSLLDVDPHALVLQCVESIPISAISLRCLLDRVPGEDDDFSYLHSDIINT